MHRECSVRRSARLRGLDSRQPTKGEHMAEQVRADGVGVVGGVDTHRDFHVGAVVDGAGRLLGSAQFGADTSGYAQLVAPMESWGRICRVGVGGTGSYGAGLTRHLTEAGIGVVEVNRPNRQLRRRRGKDDTTDAEAAARAALNGEATALPKTGDGPVEATRMLRVVRRSAVKARTQAANQLHALVVTAPEQVKHQLRDLPTRTQVKVCARFRPATAQTTAAYAKRALRLLARRYQNLDTEITQVDKQIRGLCARANPALLAAYGVGPDTAAALLVAAGDNPRRMNSEAAFAALCALSPVAASSGPIVRHRLNRGGNRQANNALWPMRYQPNAHRRCHQRICHQTRSGRKNPHRNNPLPETPHRPRDIPPPHRPAPNTPRNRPTPPPNPSPNHPHPRRPPPRHAAHRPITTRTRPPPQPPPRYPIPTLAHPTTDLQNIGASWVGWGEILGMGVRPRWNR